MTRPKLTAAQQKMINRFHGDFAMERIAIGGHQQRTAKTLERLGLVTIERRFPSLWYVQPSETNP